MSDQAADHWIDSLLHPGLNKAVDREPSRLEKLLSKWHAGELTDPERKELFVLLMHEGGYDDGRRGAELGRKVKKDRRTIHGYKNALAGDKVPGDEVLHALVATVVSERLQARILRSA